MATQYAKELKAIPALAEWYANLHAAQQESIADQVSLGLGLLWPIIELGFSDLDKATPAWLHSVTLQIQQGWIESADTAFEYVQAAKWAVEPDSPPLVKAAADFPVREVQAAMQVRGPIEVKRQVERDRRQSPSWHPYQRMPSYRRSRLPIRV